MYSNRSLIMPYASSRPSFMQVFSTRGMDKCAENCEAIRQEVEAFKTFVPLVQVWGTSVGKGCGDTGPLVQDEHVQYTCST